MQNTKYKGILFDLDGTLLDTQPDFHFILSQMAQARGLEPMSYGALKPLVGLGSKAMVLGQFPDLKPDSAEIAALKEEFLKIYRANVGEAVTRQRLFPGILDLIQKLNQANIPWGIVTNKYEDLARIAVKNAGVSGHGILVGCDTCQHAKPHPEPVLYAASELGLEASDILFVGDSETDMEAGFEAKTGLALVAWGYGTANLDRDYYGYLEIDDPLKLLEHTFIF